MADAAVQLADLDTLAVAQGSAVHLADLVATAGVASSSLQLADLAALISVGGNRLHLADLTATSTVLAAIQARPGAAQTVYPFTDVLVDGSASTGSITDAGWVQVANGAPTIPTMPVSGLVFTYRPPPALQAYSLVFELTVTDGSQVSTARRTDRVMPCENWTRIDGAWVPVPRYRLDLIDRPVGVEPVTGVPASLTASVGSSVTLTMTAGDPDGYVTGFWWRPISWPGPGFAPILLTPDQPTTDTKPFTVAGTYVFEATATGSCGLTSTPKTTVVTVT